MNPAHARVRAPADPGSQQANFQRLLQTPVIDLLNRPATYRHQAGGFSRGNGQRSATGNVTPKPTQKPFAASKLINIQSDEPEIPDDEPMGDPFDNYYIQGYSTVTLMQGFLNALAHPESTQIVPERRLLTDSDEKKLTATASNYNQRILASNGVEKKEYTAEDDVAMTDHASGVSKYLSPIKNNRKSEKHSSRKNSETQ